MSHDSEPPAVFVEFIRKRRVIQGYVKVLRLPLSFCPQKLKKNPIFHSKLAHFCNRIANSVASSLVFIESCGSCKQ